MKYKEIFFDILNNNPSDYSEIRIEETDSTRLVYKGKKLDNISQNSGFGGNVRAAYKGGWGFSSFNSISNIEQNLRNNLDEAFLQARNIGDSKTYIAEVDPNVDIVNNFSGKDPKNISIREKKQLMDHYLGIISSAKIISSSDIIYADTSRKVFFGNSEWTYIEQDHVHVVSRISVQTRLGNDIQESGFFFLLSLC